VEVEELLCFIGCVYFLIYSIGFFVVGGAAYMHPYLQKILYSS
jgi:hypothetical protein